MHLVRTCQCSAQFCAPHVLWPYLVRINLYIVPGRCTYAIRVFSAEAESLLLVWYTCLLIQRRLNWWLNDVLHQIVLLMQTIIYRDQHLWLNITLLNSIQLRYIRSTYLMQHHSDEELNWTVIQLKVRSSQISMKYVSIELQAVQR